MTHECCNRPPEQCDRARAWAGPQAIQASTGIVPLRLVLQLAVRMGLRTYHRLRIEGRENLPRGESFVLVSNHTSHLDTLCLLASLPLRVSRDAVPVAAEDYFFRTPFRARFSVACLNALPFARGRGSLESLSLCRELLRQSGRALIFYPEGTRSLDGALARFGSGIAHLVAGTDIPVVPCYLEGTHRALSKGRRFPRPISLGLSIGEPLRFPHASSRNARSRHAVADQLRLAVAALAPPHVDVDLCAPEGRRAGSRTGLRKSA